MTTPIRFLARAPRGVVLASNNKPVPAQAAYTKKPHTNIFQKVRQPAPSSGKFAPFTQQATSQKISSQPQAQRAVKKSLLTPSSSNVPPKRQRTQLQQPKPLQGKLSVKKAVLKDVVKANPPKLKVKLEPVQLAEVSFKNTLGSSKQLKKPTLVVPKIQIKKKPKQLTRPASLLKQQNLQLRKAQVKQKKLCAPQLLRATSIKKASLGNVKGKKTIKSVIKGKKKLAVTLKPIVPAFGQRKSIKGRK